jgi:hypothetical protein
MTQIRIDNNIRWETNHPTNYCFISENQRVQQLAQILTQQKNYHAQSDQMEILDRIRNNCKDPSRDKVAVTSQLSAEHAKTIHPEYHYDVSDQQDQRSGVPIRSKSQVFFFHIV